MAITNDNEFEAWLEKQDQPTHIAIATRAALRVFPLVATGTDTNEYLQTFTLLTGRAILTSAVACIWPTADVKNATLAAATALATTDATTDATDAAIHAADAAINAALATHTTDATDATTTTTHVINATTDADHATDDPTAIHAAAAADTRITADDPFTIDLWHDEGMPKTIEESWSKFQKLAAEDNPWAFWREWYQSFLDANPLDWELQKKIALIPDSVWDKGVAHIALVIEKIRAAHTPENIPPDQPIPSREDITAIQGQLANLEKKFATSKKNITSNVDNLAIQVTEAIGDLTKLETTSKDKIETIDSDYKKALDAAAAAFGESNALAAPVELWRKKQSEHEGSRDTAFF